MSEIKEKLTTENINEVDTLEQTVPVEDEKLETKKTKKKSAIIFNAVRLVVLVIAAGALIVASYSLTESYLDYKEDEEKYAAINNMFVKQEGDTGEKTENQNQVVSNGEDWVWDYEAMLEYNNEAKGYIKLEGSRIQYPIVEHSDNSFYLFRGADKITNGSGSLFLDYRTAGLEGNMCIIYGHNMLDGSMFKDLMNYRDKEFCKDNQVFDVYVGYKHYKYYVFAAFTAKDTDENVYNYGFESDYEFQTWINKVCSKSNYNFDCDKPTTDDKIIMCSTCIDDEGLRYLVCMYRGEEVIE